MIQAMYFLSLSSYLSFSCVCPFFLLISLSLFYHSFISPFLLLASTHSSVKFSMAHLFFLIFLYQVSETISFFLSHHQILPPFLFTFPCPALPHSLPRSPNSLHPPSFLPSGPFSPPSPRPRPHVLLPSSFHPFSASAPRLLFRRR